MREYCAKCGSVGEHDCQPTDDRRLPMMSDDRLCVCGHEKNRHVYISQGESGDCLSCRRGACIAYRPASDSTEGQETPHEKVARGICPLCNHFLSHHDKYGACDYIRPRPELGDRMDICNCGHGERMKQQLQEWQDAKDAPTPSLQERIGKALKRGDLKSSVRELLVSALAESQSWFAQYQAWMKRGMEAEQREAALTAQAAAYREALEFWFEHSTCLCGARHDQLDSHPHVGGCKIGDALC